MQLWYEAVEKEHNSLFRAYESYKAAYVSCMYYADKASRAPVWPKKFQATYTSERKFEVKEFAHAYLQYSFQQIADAFGMPKMTAFNIITQKPSEEPVKGRATGKELDDHYPIHQEWKSSWSSGCWR